jgi:uncharacterized protein (DUF2141 family)
MKKLALTIGFILMTFIVKAQEGVTITATVNNVKNDSGKVIFALHTEDTFMKGPGLQNASSIIEDGKVNVTFKNVPKGTYAILVLHDENDNNRMDFEANGMPKESFGISNNDMSMGPPQFSAAKFTVTDKNLTFDIRF